jgi:hypothetical protein
VVLLEGKCNEMPTDCQGIKDGECTDGDEWVLAVSCWHKHEQQEEGQEKMAWRHSLGN